MKSKLEKELSQRREEARKTALEHEDTLATLHSTIESLKSENEALQQQVKSAEAKAEAKQVELIKMEARLRKTEVDVEATEQLMNLTEKTQRQEEAITQTRTSDQSKTPKFNFSCFDVLCVLLDFTSSSVVSAKTSTSGQRDVPEDKSRGGSILGILQRGGELPKSSRVSTSSSDIWMRSLSTPFI